MKLILLICLLVSELYAYPDTNSIGLEFLEEILESDPDINRNVSEIISSKGYVVENHDVITEDGYILSVQRLPHGLKRTQGPKEAVFLQHGLLSSSFDWVSNSPAESLGFLLADAGYDVWLGNVRGNTYSSRHTKLTPKEGKFWDFSFDEMALKDLPAMIDYVLKTTGQQRLSYIGHSQGTTIAFAMLSAKPEYNKKLKVMAALAPVVNAKHIRSAIRYIVPFTYDVELMFKLFGVHEFLPSDILMKYLAELVCDTKLREICSDVVFLICGSDMAQLNKTRLGVYVAHTPAGTSTRNIVHWAQLVKSSLFRMYDFGEKGNILNYNQTTPPQYNLGNIAAPVAIMWGRNDELADPVDVGILESQLKSLVSSTCVLDPLFNHLDFVWGINAVHDVYQTVFKILKKYAV